MFSKKKEKPKNDRFSNLKEEVEVDSKFQMFGLIQTFITELNMKEKEVYKINYLHALNWLSYWYQRNKAQESKNSNKIL